MQEEEFQRDEAQGKLRIDAVCSNAPTRRQLLAKSRTRGQKPGWHALPAPASNWTLAARGQEFPNAALVLNCPPQRKRGQKGGKKLQRRGGKRGGSAAGKVPSEKRGKAGPAKGPKGNAGPRGAGGSSTRNAPPRVEVLQGGGRRGGGGVWLLLRPLPQGRGSGEWEGEGRGGKGGTPPALTRRPAAHAAPATSRPRRLPRPTAAPKPPPGERGGGGGGG